MFGYIKIYKPEMKFKDFDAYHDVYCSLCNQLGKNYGLSSRLTLNYDFTFLAVLQLAIADDEPCFNKKRCTFNPLKKCNNCHNSDSVFSYVTSVAVMIIYFKLLDNFNDEKLGKIILSKMLMSVVKQKYKKASLKYDEINLLMKDMAVSQNSAENEKSSVDKSAHPTADLLGKIFSYNINDDIQKQVLYRLGYCLGRYVYFMDALDDYHKDIKNKTYNPFIVNNNISKAEEIINNTIGEAILAFNLLKLKRYNDILENIIYLGLSNNLKILLNKKGGNH